jgi:hypothetical protein
MSRIRGVQDIRTVAGRVNQTFKPYKAFLRISCMEMEKARMIKEKEGLLRRMKSIDTRIEAMETEKNTLLDSIGRPGENGRSSGEVKTGEAVSDVPAGFRLKY